MLDALIKMLDALINPFGVVSWRWGYWHPAVHLGFEGLGYGVAWAVYRVQTVPDVLSPKVRRRIKWWTLGGAILGAKLVPVLEQVGQPLWWTALISGKSLAGGLAGGIAGTEWIKRRLGIAGSTGDVLVWPLVWGSVMGRLGCASCAVLDGMVGRPFPPELATLAGSLRSVLAIDTTWAEATTLPDSMQTLLQLNTGWHWNIGLMELFGLLGLAVGLRCWQIWLARKGAAMQAGQLFYGFCTGYFMLRMGLESLKHIPQEGLTVVQGVSLLGLSWALWRLVRLSLCAKKDQSKCLTELKD